jgi:Mrp family chromosome partitioning ATPase
MTPEESPVLRDPQSLFAEVARQLAAEVQHNGPDSGAQSVLITSPLPGDGKSTVALSLVAAAAALGRRAVLVDLDLRKPDVLQKLQYSLYTPDLVDYLTGTADVHKMLPAPQPHSAREIETYPPVVLSTREPVRDPASLMRVGKLQSMFDALREQFDLIVINAPATLAVRDARTMTDVADTTLMVVRWGSTTIEQMRASNQLLHGRIDGVVFNRVDYAEHARRGYGDAVEFYRDSASYYSGPVPQRRPVFGWLRRLFGTSREAAV